MAPLARRRPSEDSRAIMRSRSASREGLPSDPTNPALAIAQSDEQFRSPDIAGFLSIVLGMIGLVAWLIPWAGFGVGVFGLMAGIRSRYDRRRRNRRFALMGLGLCGLCIVLSVSNFMVAEYMGASGKNMFSGILF